MSHPQSSSDWCSLDQLSPLQTGLFGFILVLQYIIQSISFNFVWISSAQFYSAFSSLVHFRPNCFSLVHFGAVLVQLVPVQLNLIWPGSVSLVQFSLVQSSSFDSGLVQLRMFHFHFNSN